VRQGHLHLLLGRTEADRIHHAVVVTHLSCEAVEVAAQILRQRRLVLGKAVSKHLESDTELGCVNELVDASGLIGADLAAKQDHEATKPPRQIRMCEKVHCYKSRGQSTGPGASVLSPDRCRPPGAVRVGRPHLPRALVTSRRDASPMATLPRLGEIPGWRADVCST
jgi:hypothetical protein